MPNVLFRTLAHPAFALGGAVLWGLIEVVALARVRAIGFLRRPR